MDYRQIISQNKLTIINYFNIDYITSEHCDSDDSYVYAITKHNQKVLLGRYFSEAECRQIICCINSWLSCDTKFKDMPEFNTCSYESFVMPKNFLAKDDAEDESAQVKPKQSLEECLFPVKDIQRKIAKEKLV